MYFELFFHTAKIYTLNAMNGDKVIVNIIAKSTGDKKREGKILRITKRANTQVVGTYSQSRNFGFVIPDDKKITKDIFVHKIIIFLDCFFI